MANTFTFSPGTTDIATGAIKLTDFANWNTGTWFNAGAATRQQLVLSPTPGSDIIGAQYKYFYVSSVKCTWTVTRADHSGDQEIEIMLLPFNKAQLDTMTGTYPQVYAGSGLTTQTWQNMKTLPNARYGRIASSANSLSRATLKQYVSLRKYLIPGFPLASQAFWVATNNGDSTGWTAPADDYSAWLLFGVMSPTAAATTWLNCKIKLTYYITAFQQYLPSTMLP